MRLSSPRRLVVLVVVGVLASLVAGCSVVGTSPAQSVRRAFVTTVAAGPAQVAVAARTTVAGQAVDVTGDGVVDVSGQAADLTLHLPTIGDLRTVVVRGVAYAQVPAMFSFFLADSKPWASVNLDRLAQLQFGTPLAQLGGTSNPFEQLRYLEGIRDDAREVGREPIDGVETTHYSATIDLDRTPAAQDPATRPAVDRLRALLGSAALPVEVWVDDDGRIRRATQTIAPNPSPGATPDPSSTGSTTTVTFRAYGVPADISAPPPDQVTDLASLLPTG